jgi:putative hydroxymethylpyrimidine transporter CytX
MKKNIPIERDVKFRTNFIKLPPEWGPEPVPERIKTLGFLDYFVLWSSLGVGLLVFLAGSLLVPGLSLFEVFMVSLAGSVVGSLLLASAGLIGSKYGIPTMVSLRAIMGKKGSFVPTFFNIIQLVGWTAFEIMIMSQAATSISGPIFGGFTNHFWVIVFGVFCGLLAIGGPLIVIRHWLEKFAVWIIYGLTIWITYQIFSSPNVADLIFRPGDGSIPFLFALDLVIAMPISWWPLISDFNRFSREEKSAFTGTFLGYTLSNTWFYFIGAALIVILGARDIISSILGLIFGSLAMVLILVDETDNAFADIYSAAVSFQNIFSKTKQWKFIVLIDVAGIILAMSLPLAQYEVFLLMIGALFVPLLGVVFSDYILLRKQNYSIDEFYENATGVKIGAIISWLIGIATYFFIYTQYPEIGASLPAFAISALSHYLIGKMS